MNPRGLNLGNLLTLAILLLGIILTTYNVHFLHVMQREHLNVLHPETADCTLGEGPSYSVFAKVNLDQDNNITRIIFY
jgi:hypothetical protein